MAERPQTPPPSPAFKIEINADPETTLWLFRSEQREQLLADARAADDSPTE